MFAIIVSKKQLRLAVDRNRLRRRIRSALDQVQPNWRSLEAKIVADKRWLPLPFPELKSKIVFLLQRAKIHP